MPLIPVKDKATPSNRLKKLTTNYLDRIVNINMIAHKHAGLCSQEKTGDTLELTRPTIKGYYHFNIIMP